MDSNSTEIVHEFPSLFRVYKDGRIERLMATEIIPPGTDSDTGVQSKDVTISSETGVSSRLFIPKTADTAKKLPLLIYIHGGAFCIASAFNPAFHKHAATLAAQANVVVLSVNYRLAPEHPLPIAYDDTWNAVQWAASHVNRNGPEMWLNDFVDFQRVFFAGDSAGANLAHNMAIRASVDGLNGLKLDGILLIHPYFGNDQPDKLIEYLYPTMSGLDDPRINAVKDPKLSSLGCSRVVIFIGGKDFLRERGKSYYEALKNSGWSGGVELVETEDEGHVFHLYLIGTGKNEYPKCTQRKG
ncbi:Alpha/beta hydrolase fold protein [Quillaja saponaria]|uniref:Alpha/beta hydrolase fold protein n=1 Tax=Quillaja saponaria TaxID=32244 RepID=A0AAD7KUK8_QUISA|nr:Alpha/beta hydrolase fold protein [Quillaja saponaria]